MSESNRDAMLLFSRFCLSFLFLWGGIVKAMNPGAFAAHMAQEGMPAGMLLAWLAVTIEIGGGLALLFGVATRTMALLFIPYIVVATLIDHRFWEMAQPAYTANRVNLTKNLAILPGMLLLAHLGPGNWSLDALFGRTKAAQPA
jgi:putative oxidoreductase